MPARVDSYWEARLKSVKSNNPNWGGPRLWRTLQEEATAVGRPDAPSQGWVSKWLREGWPKVSDAERRGHRMVYWPESFEHGDLPWEAAQAALELLGHFFQHPRSSRPPVSLGRWFWRATQVAADTSTRDRVRVAAILRAAESVDPPESEQLRRDGELFLAYAPWRSDLNNRRYESALQRSDGITDLRGEPILPTPFRG